MGIFSNFVNLFFQVNKTYSSIRAQYMIINGYLEAGLLSTDPGNRLISVGNEGTFLLTAQESMYVHELEVFGQMDVFNPVIFRGEDIEKMEKLTIGESGSLTLDYNAQSSKTWTGVSEIPLHYAYISGQFKAGNMINHYNNTENEGWNYMYLHNGSSTLEFETADPFYIDTADINGTFTSYKPIAIRAFTPDNPLNIFIGWAGHVTFDSQASHPIGPFTSNSSIYGVRWVTDESSNFQAGNTHFVLDHLEIGGTLTARPESTVQVKNLVVTSSGDVNITTPVDIIGEVMDNSGLIDIDYRRWPENTDEGNENTNINMETSVTVSGTLQAGSLYIETGDMSVSGKVDVNGGGYLTDKGPGKKSMLHFLISSKSI